MSEYIRGKAARILRGTAQGREETGDRNNNSYTYAEGAWAQQNFNFFYIVVVGRSQTDIHFS